MTVPEKRCGCFRIGAIALKVVKSPDYEEISYPYPVLGTLKEEYCRVIGDSSYISQCLEGKDLPDTVAVSC